MRVTLSLVCALAALALPAPAFAVVGGAAVHSGAYPFVVAVGNTDGTYCGGTLIAPNVVLTAAHCITGRPTTLQHLRVLVGSPRLRADLATPDGVHVLGVSAVYVHPKFSEATMRYDAALLTLDHSISGRANARTGRFVAARRLDGERGGLGRDERGWRRDAHAPAQRRPEGRHVAARAHRGNADEGRVLRARACCVRATPGATRAPATVAARSSARQRSRRARRDHELRRGVRRGRVIPASTRAPRPFARGRTRR